MGTALTLTFSVLDDIAFAVTRGRFDPSDGVPTVRAVELGPLLALRHFAAIGTLPVPEQASWLILDGAQPLLGALGRDIRAWTSVGGDVGFYRTASAGPAETDWVAFGLALQQSLIRVGRFNRQPAQQLVGALGELRDNIREHSHATATGLVAFQVARDRCALVVSDLGIGVRESLRSNPEYHDLTDHGSALQLALTDGISRYGASSGRGLGFRALFIGLANLDGFLRFHSGDHALMINGQSPTRVSARTAQKPLLPGFFVSIACRSR